MKSHGRTFGCAARIIGLCAIPTGLLSACGADAEAPDPEVRSAAGAIIGGTLVPPGDPVARSTLILRGDVGRCSASLVDGQFALAAAHCILGNRTLTVGFGIDASAPDLPTRPVVEVI